MSTVTAESPAIIASLVEYKANVESMPIYAGQDVGPMPCEYKSAEKVEVAQYLPIVGRTGKSVAYPILAVCPCGVHLVARPTKSAKEGVIGAYLPKQGVLVQGNSFLLALQGISVKRDSIGFPLRMRKEIIETMKLHSLDTVK